MTDRDLAEYDKNAPLLERLQQQIDNGFVHPHAKECAKGAKEEIERLTEALQYIAYAAVHPPGLGGGFVADSEWYKGVALAMAKSAEEALKPQVKDTTEGE